MDWQMGIVLILVSIAAWTDLSVGRIYNWNTYTGMLIGLGMSFLSESRITPGDAFSGWWICGLIMLVCYVLLNVGGGDVKLIAMLGACLGLEDGLNALLWTCTIAAITAAASVIWQVGAWELLKGTVYRMKLLIQAKGGVPWSPEQRRTLNQRFRFGPSALAAVLLIYGMK
ncbi:MAG: prepilin peptidase [Planctomycetota bacterium]|jgi:prepilin peptidase CpaA|nr:MAG: prepilin peptidase [Planctomycetota bacterium]